MSPSLLGPPMRVGCSACPGSENTTFDSRKSQTPRTYASASVGRTLGSRSLNAFSSLRGSFKGRRALLPTTNQKPVGLAMIASASNSPVGLPAKQKWYESLRGKPSQIPTPSSPSSMSSTLKRSQFFRSLPTQLPTGELPPIAALQTQAARDPLPRLHIPSLQSELQCMFLFGEPTERLFVDTESKPQSQNSTHKDVVRFQTKMYKEAKSESQAHVATVVPATDSKLSFSRPAANAQKTRDEKPTSSTAIISAPAGKKPLEPWRILCDLYYKGTPWHPEHKKSMLDATSALSQFALRHMLSEHHDCSNTLLWTNEIRTGQLQVNQTFTVYPHIDGPLRKEIRKNHNLRWAFITFTNGPSTMRRTDLHEEDERLMMAIRYVTSMGYHIDLWTYLDDDEWDVDLDMAEAELARGSEKRKEMRSSSCSQSVFLDPQHRARRERYTGFVQHGVAGFLQADLDLLDKLRSEVLRSERLGWNVDNNSALIGVGHSKHIEPARLPQSQVQTVAGSELMGFLEHTEETIAEVD